ncbi:MAG TPA: phosphotransferase family protein [Cytophagales bacterium]|nr:phosphotransferase family protein [Cytophagales bacterium]HAA20440.1 phosphotransferase family protein [Cytophagales bacterium]HAP61312.1 phosphotransferase family protein [Cytophagales bacterium]
MTQIATDQPTSIRAGEELPLEDLKRYLQEQLSLSGDLEVAQFPSGFSNLTYFVSLDQQAMVLRRPPVGANIATAHDMSREYRVLTLLQPHFEKIPKPLLYCEDTSVIGAPFYVMSRVEGVVLRGFHAKLAPEPALMRELSTTVAHTLADLHNVDIDGTGLVDLGKPEGYVVRQVKGWIKRYRAAATDTIVAMDEMASWMERNVPERESVAFIHNDFKYDNLVLKSDRLTEVNAVLDWEMATVGDPLMDLGTTLAYWTEASDPDIMKPYNLSWLPGNLKRSELAEAYASARNLTLEVEQLLFYYVFGLFKIAVIGQQIYARFKAGLTQDERFGALIHVVKTCAETGRLALEKGKISDVW